MNEAIIQYNDDPNEGNLLVISWKKFVRCKDCINLLKLPMDRHGHQPYFCKNLNIYTEGLDWFCADGVNMEGRMKDED